MLWVNTAGAQKKQTPDTDTVCFVDYVGLDHQILTNKFRGVGRIGQNSPYLGCSEKNVFRAFAFKELSDGLAFCEVQLTVRTENYIIISAVPKAPHQCGTD
jgi:hypothetical protein